MAKPARVKKKKEEAAPLKKGAKAAAKGKVKEVPAKGKAKGKTGEKAKAAGGLRARMAKSQPKTAKARGKAAPKEHKAMKFFREVRVELSKVTWPSREELIQSTIVVTIAVVIAGVFIFLFDDLFSYIIGLFTG